MMNAYVSAESGVARGALRCQALAERPYAARNRNAPLRRRDCSPPRCELRVAAKRSAPCMARVRAHSRLAWTATARAGRWKRAWRPQNGRERNTSMPKPCAYGQLRQELGYPAPTSKWPLPKPC